jgi:hypothetical protein
MSRQPLKGAISVGLVLGLPPLGEPRLALASGSEMLIAEVSHRC